MRLRNKVVSLSMALAVSGMLAMSGSKVYASDTDTYTETIATGTDAVKEVEEIEEVEAAGEEEAAEAAAAGWRV